MLSTNTLLLYFLTQLSDDSTEPPEDSTARASFFALIDPNDFNPDDPFDELDEGTDDDSFDSRAEVAASSFARSKPSDPSDYYAHNKEQETEHLINLMKKTAPEAPVEVRHDQSGLITSKKYMGKLRDITSKEIENIESSGAQESYTQAVANNNSKPVSTDSSDILWLFCQLILLYFFYL